MKAFFAALAFTLVAAIAGAYVLNLYQVPAAEKFATVGVRLGTEN
jgi:Cu/Ag efflux pump CusA